MYFVLDCLDFPLYLSLTIGPSSMFTPIRLPKDNRNKIIETQQVIREKNYLGDKTPLSKEYQIHSDWD